MESDKPNYRLSKVATELNISVDSLITYLKSQGYNLGSDPNCKLTIEQYTLCKENIGQIQETIIVQAKLLKENSERLDSKSEPSISHVQSWKIGQIKFFDNTKGFGFVDCWDYQMDYFVHISKAL